MFCREALVWRQLRHPHVLPFFGVDAETFKATGHICMVSPWMSRGTLAQLISSTNVPGPNRIRLVRLLVSLRVTLTLTPYLERKLQQVAEGIAYLHLLKIVHGDIHGVCSDFSLFAQQLLPNLGPGQYFH
jgi:serine/threonine protein kinase